jgi:intracellular multiplication protein IcmD
MFFKTKKEKEKMKKILNHLVVLGSTALFSISAMAQSSVGGSSGDTIGDVADTVLTSLGSVETMIVVLCYIAGLGFAGAGILKFKQHKDNPTQVPLGAPIAMIFIAAALIYLPQVIKTTGSTLFGGGQQSAEQYLEGGTEMLR